MWYLETQPTHTGDQKPDLQPWPSFENSEGQSYKPHSLTHSLTQHTHHGRPAGQQKSADTHMSLLCISRQVSATHGTTARLTRSPFTLMQVWGGQHSKGWWVVPYMAIRKRGGCSYQLVFKEEQWRKRLNPFSSIDTRKRQQQESARVYMLVDGNGLKIRVTAKQSPYRVQSLVTMLANSYNNWVSRLCCCSL
jgi:hypothetical protein